MITDLQLKNIATFLVIITIPSIIFSLIRPVLAGFDSYLYMNLNLLLGLFPLLFAWLFVTKKGGKYLTVLWFLLWLGFLPNAPYMITDLIHIADVGPRALLWYDGLMLFGFALSGMVSWLVSVHLIYQKIRFTYFIPIITFLTSIGMYLGRFVRFNTWDLLQKPWELAIVFFETITQPFEHHPFLLFTAVFWIFLLASYFGYQKLFQTKNES